MTETQQTHISHADYMALVRALKFQKDAGVNVFLEAEPVNRFDSQTLLRFLNLKVTTMTSHHMNYQSHAVSHLPSFAKIRQKPEIFRRQKVPLYEPTLSRR